MVFLPRPVFPESHQSSVSLSVADSTINKLQQLITKRSTTYHRAQLSKINIYFGTALHPTGTKIIQFNSKVSKQTSDLLFFSKCNQKLCSRQETRTTDIDQNALMP